MKGSFIDESASHQCKMLKTETNQLRPAGCGKSWMHPAEAASAPLRLASLSVQMSEQRLLKNSTGLESQNGLGWK